MADASSTAPGTAAAAPGAAGSGPAWSGPPRCARAARAAIKVGAVRRAAILSVVTTIADRPLAAARDDLLLRRRADPATTCSATKWTPLLRGDQQSFGVIPLIWGTLYLTAHRPAGRDPARAAVRDLPRRVRAAARPQGRQADARDAGRRPDDRLRLLRAHLLHAGRHPRRSASTSTSSTRCRPGIILGLLVLPTIASVAEDAMSAVPASLREGAFGLGATKLQVSLRIVFPAALSGIVAALILGASRAVGETVIILIAGGQTRQPRASTRASPTSRWRRSSPPRRAATSRPARSSTRRSSSSASRSS